MRVAIDDLWLCEECTVAASECDLPHPDDTDPARDAEITAGLDRLGRHLVPDFDSETGAGIRGFMSRPCACCQSPLAGSRHRFAILGT